MIKNVIFDIGDVLIEYRWKEILREYGLSEEDVMRVGREIFINPHCQILDLGTIDKATIVDAYAKMYPEDEAVIRYFMERGEELKIIRTEVWEKIYLLKEKGYRIYLLSNYPKDLFREHVANTHLMEIVDGAVVSSKIHMMKPDKRIYRYLLSKYELNPSECIFFDDKKENTEAAIEMGIAAVTIHSKTQLLGEIEKLMQ